MKTIFLIPIVMFSVLFVGIQYSYAFFEEGIVIEVPGQAIDISNNVISPGQTMFVNGTFNQHVDEFTASVFKDYGKSRKLVLTLSPSSNEYGDFDFDFSVPDDWELGHYTIVLENGLQSMYWEFTIRQNHGGGSLDRTIYPVPWTTASPLKQSQHGIPFNEIQCNKNLVLIQKHDRSPACVTESTKLKLVERGWARMLSGNLILHEAQSWGYIKDVLMLNDGRVGITMSYPTNEAYHELYPDEYNSIVGDCDVQYDSAMLSLLYLNDIDSDANTITFTKEYKSFDGMSCKDAFWDEMTQHGYCGPPPHLMSQRETLTSSITDAQNMVDFSLVVPKYLPEGYDVQKISIGDDRKHATLFISPSPVTTETDMCAFTWDDEGIYLYYVSIPDDAPRFSNDPDKEKITINGNRGYVEHRWIGDRAGMPIPQRSEVTWHIPEGNLVLDMISSLSSEELIKIAKSVE